MWGQTRGVSSRTASRSLAVGSNGQRGAYGLEFGIVFIALFALFYAVLTLGLIMTARQSLQLAAEDAARVSLRYQAAGTSILPQLQARVNQACAVATSRSSWIGGMGGSSTTCAIRVSGAGLCGATGACCLELRAGGSSVNVSGCTTPASGWNVSVSVSYDQYRQHPLVPTLPGLGFVLPTRLVAQASAWLAPSMLDQGA